MPSDFWEIIVVEGPLAPPPPLFTADSGAVVDFFGVVRGQEGSRRIEALEYEAYRPMAEHQLACLGQQAAAKFDLHGLLLYHRIGRVPVTEPSLFVRTSTRHRQAGFEAAQWIVERLKEVVPIWKHACPDPGTIPAVSAGEPAPAP